MTKLKAANTKFVALIACLIMVVGCETTQPQEMQSKTPLRVSSPALAFENGRWFNGKDFVQGPRFCVNGVFTNLQPDSIDKVIDLSGQYVIPPLAEAHTHHFDNPGIFDAVNQMSLDQGIFYAISMTNWVEGKQGLKAQTELPTTIDVAYADAGITATYGHPILIYESLARNDFSFDRTKVEYAKEPRALDGAYRILDTAADIERVWQETLASSPDLVKIYLLRSEEYELRKNRTETYGDRGLNPDLVPLLVENARMSNLRVAAHVESAFDFDVAVNAGVHIIAHLPGYGPEVGESLNPYRVSEASAVRAAQQGTVVIPTPVADTEARYKESNPDYTKEVRALQRENIATLHKAGVKMAVGADAYFSTPKAEFDQLAAFDVFTPEELLNMWTKISAQLAFPNRAIGELTVGFEASFISLSSNPLNDFSALDQIQTRVKSCHVF